MKPIIIHILHHPKFVGDKNQALGIVSAMRKQFGEHIKDVREWLDAEESQLQQMQHSCLTRDKELHVIIAVGDHGIVAIQRINKFANMMIIYASHLIFLNLIESLSKIDLLALPTHVITPEIISQCGTKNVKLERTLGVAHNVQPEELAEEYQKWQSTAQAIRPANQYIGVILGGDAPDEKNEMRYFPASQAKTLGTYLIELYKKHPDALFLICNSPRTGKFDPDTKKELEVHKGTTIDPTSSALLQVLDAGQIPYQFFDFVQGQPSAYKPILGAIHAKPGSMTLVTGDSTSMVTEISNVLSMSPLKIVLISSMNESHMRHVQSVQQAGLAAIVTLEPTITLVEPLKEASISLSAAAQIVSTLQTLIKTKVAHTATNTALPPNVASLLQFPKKPDHSDQTKDANPPASNVSPGNS